MTLDYGQLAGSPKINADSSFTFALNGTFFDIDKPAASPFHPAAFDPADLQGHMLEGYFTDYVLNTMFLAGFQTGHTLDVTHILSLLNITITTGELGLVIPEFITKYGKDKAVKITAAFVDEPSTSSIAPTG